MIKKLTWWQAFLGLLIVAFVGLLVWVRPKAYRIPTSAMEPTLQGGDTILSGRPLKSGDKLFRGSVVIFDGPKTRIKGLGGSQIKRLIALPGDRIEVLNGELTVNGIPLPTRGGEHAKPPGNAYTPAMSTPRYPLVVPEGTAFVLGDHYSNSLDSRYYGLIPIIAIERIAWARLFPMRHAGKIE
ncbi:S26 family signal peptidase [Luteolibacter sp. LG18]|nr:S26 family signal peptidase [Luteolibacter sp. LG18]